MYAINDNQELESTAAGRAGHAVVGEGPVQRRQRAP